MSLGAAHPERSVLSAAASAAESKGAEPKGPRVTDGFLDKVKFDDRGLVPVICQDEDGTVLMLAWANREALDVTARTGEGTYWSRSRKELWRKGATSGHTQRVLEIRLDCDEDAVLYLVRQTGPACHTGARSCFSSP